MIDSQTLAVDDNRYRPAMPRDDEDAADALCSDIANEIELGLLAVARNVAEKFPQFVVLVDGTPQFFVGLPDPTPTADDLGQDRYCNETTDRGFVCTWPTGGHPHYPHVAGDGDFIVAVWR